MAVECFTLLPHNLAKPFCDNWTLYIIVINPALIPRVVGRIDVDALHLTCVIGEQRLQRGQVIPFHDQIPAPRITATKIRYILEQMKGNLLVMIHHGLFSNPVQRRHRSGQVTAALRGLIPKSPRQVSRNFRTFLPGQVTRQFHEEDIESILRKRANPRSTRHCLI